MLVHPASRHLLILLVHVPMERKMRLLKVPTAGGVAAAEWLAATLGGGDVNVGGPGTRTSAVDYGLCPGFEGRGTSASPSSYLLTVHDDDDHPSSLP